MKKGSASGNQNCESGSGSRRLFNYLRIHKIRISNSGLGKPVLGTVPKVHKQVPVPVDMVPVLIPNADTENFKTYPQNTKEENNKKNTKKEEETLSTPTTPT